MKHILIKGLGKMKERIKGVPIPFPSYDKYVLLKGFTCHVIRTFSFFSVCNVSNNYFLKYIFLKENIICLQHIFLQ